MIDLTDLRRVRLRRGTRTHAVSPGRRVTDCGVMVKLTGPAGSPYDHPAPPEQEVTCRECLNTTARRSPSA